MRRVQVIEELDSGLRRVGFRLGMSRVQATDE